jgi:Phosphotransferase enzyme family
MTVDEPWAELVATAFDAGRATGPLARVDGGISHALFRLPTTSGIYAAKRLNVVAE